MINPIKFQFFFFSVEFSGQHSRNSNDLNWILIATKIFDWLLTEEFWLVAINGVLNPFFLIKPPLRLFDSKNTHVSIWNIFMFLLFRYLAYLNSIKKLHRAQNFILLF